MVSFDNTYEIQFSEMIPSIDEFMNTRYPHEIFDYYCPSELTRKIKIMKEVGRNHRFFIEKLDEPQFGRDFRAYVIYEIEGGLKIFSEFSSISALTSAPFRIANCPAFTMRNEEDVREFVEVAKQVIEDITFEKAMTLMFSNGRYGRDKKTRDQFAKTSWYVTTDF